jgi:hypothetical protein
MREGRLPKDRLKMIRNSNSTPCSILPSPSTANLPTPELLRKYESILRDELGIGKILLFKFGEHWNPCSTPASPVLWVIQ